MSLQKNRFRSAKNVIFSLLCILVDRPGGFEPPTPPLRTPLKCEVNKYKYLATKSLEETFQSSGQQALVGICNWLN